MAILDILEFPDPRLRTVAKPVEVVDDKIKRLVADMFDTMKDAQGIGLAASQVDVHLRVIVMDLGEEGPRRGCLSIRRSRFSIRTPRHTTRAVSRYPDSMKPLTGLPM